MRFPHGTHGVVSRAWGALFTVLAFAAADAFAATPHTVLVFGDSLSAGYNLSPGQGWVDLVAARITREKLPWRVVNASISGETTDGALRRLPEDLKRHMPDVVVIELGANDALRGQPLAGIRTNLEQIIRLVRQARAEPVLVGLMIPPNYGIEYASGFRDLYADIAKKQKVTFVPFLLAGIAEKPELFQADQLHPVAKAEPAVADNVWAVLGPLLARRKP